MSQHDPVTFELHKCQMQKKRVVITKHTLQMLNLCIKQADWLTQLLLGLNARYT